MNDKDTVSFCVLKISEEKIIVATQLGNKCKCYNHVLISSEYSFSRNVIVCRSIQNDDLDKVECSCHVHTCVLLCL